MEKLKQWTCRRPRTALVLAYTAIFMALCGVWVAIFAVNGRSFIWYADTIKQHFPALVYYGRWLRQAARCLLTGQAVPTWDLSIGYGADILTTLSYYVIGDPLNLLAALVPSQHIELLLEFLMLFRGWLAGLAFMAYSLYHRNSRFGTLLGMVAYTFCGWFVQTALTEPFFIIPMYCFPLVLLGADYLFDGKRPTLYIAALALAALSNFLFFYMIALLLAAYCVVKYFYRYGVKNLRTLPPLVAKFVAFSLVGIAISAVTMLPTVREMLGGARFTLERQLSSYPFEQTWRLIANLPNTAKVDEYSTYIGITAVAFLGVLVLFAKKGSRLLKAAWLCCIAIMLTPWAGKVLNGFSYMQNRWVWAFALLEAFMLARVCPGLTALDRGERLRLFALLTGWLVLAFWYDAARTEWALLCAVLVVLLAVWLLCAEGSPALTRAVLLAGCCLGIVINLGYQYGSEESDTMVEYKTPGFAWNMHVPQNPTNLLKQVEDDGLWRYDTNQNIYVNSAMLMDLNGVSYFFSLNNGWLSQWMAEMGYNTPEEYNYVGLHGRSVLDSFAGVKYYLGDTGQRLTMPAGVDPEEIMAGDIAGQTYCVYQNEAALPIGFTADARMTRADYEALTPVERQSALLDAVLLEDDAGTALPAVQPDTSRVVTADAQVTLNGVERLDETTYYAPADGGSIVFTVAQPAQNCESYLVVEGMDYRATNPMDAVSEEELAAMDKLERRRMEKQYAHFWSKEKVYLRLVSNLGEGRIDYAMPNNQYYCGRHDFVYHFGKSDTGLTTLTVVLPWAGYYTFENLSIQYQLTDDLADRAAARRANGELQNVTLGANSLSGTITTTGRQVLVIQIPYSDGWSAAVDGQPARLLRADTGFLGLELEEGEHTIQLDYRTPGLALGGAISLLGLAAFSGISLWPKRKKAVQKEKIGV